MVDGEKLQIHSESVTEVWKCSQTINRGKNPTTPAFFQVALLTLRPKLFMASWNVIVGAF